MTDRTQGAPTRCTVCGHPSFTFDGHIKHGSECSGPRTRVLVAQAATPANEVEVVGAVLEGVIIEAAPPMSFDGFFWRAANPAITAWQANLLQAFADAGSVSLQSVGEAFSRVAESMSGLRICEEEPPTDPRERALWAKSNRGYGPEAPKSWRKR